MNEPENVGNLAQLQEPVAPQEPVAAGPQAEPEAPEVDEPEDIAIQAQEQGRLDPAPPAAVRPARRLPEPAAEGPRPKRKSITFVSTEQKILFFLFKGGRPPGSKNKPKTTRAASPEQPAAGRPGKRRPDTPPNAPARKRKLKILLN